jgi:hypothetical protein
MTATAAGDRYDQARFDELKDAEGFITKEQFLAADGPMSPTKAGEGKKLPTKEEAEAESAADMAAAASNGVDWKAVHSIARWNKPLDEVAAVITSALHANCVDTGNGNYPIHIAAQNGHAELVQWLVENGAKTDVQNGTGQTPMHMSTSYDYDTVTEYLRSQNANFDICNWNGHPAKFGIDGEKNPDDVFVMLESCTTTETALAALAAVEKSVAEDNTSVEKSKFAMTGMQLKKGNKKLPKEQWTPECQEKFAALMSVMA